MGKEGREETFVKQALLKYAYVKGKAKVGRNIGPTRLSIILGSLYDIVLLYPWP